MLSSCRFLIGYINEEFSNAQEEEQAPSKFLTNGRKPQVGMRTETNVYVTDGTWFRLSGLVSEIGPTPTNLQLDLSNSTNWHHHLAVCSHSNCTFHGGSCREKKAEILSRYGALHGQRIKSLAILSYDFNDYLDKPVSETDVVELTLVCDDSRSNVWQVEGIKTLYNSYFGSNTLPTYFRHFMEWYSNGKPCQCNYCHSTLKEVCYGVNGCSCLDCRVGEMSPRPKINTTTMEMIRYQAKSANIVSDHSENGSDDGHMTE